MQATESPHKIYPQDLLAVYILNGLMNGKNSFSPGEIAEKFPRLHKNSSLELVGFNYSLQGRDTKLSP